ncbi:MAG: M48 family metallopeptidase [Candidatus Competibacter sp.]|nr:M48 family metallopeptidase [Candidatus Competibacter sp.]
METDAVTPRLIDYVVAHELAHLLEPHHAPEFWSVLDRAMPDWRERREEFKNAGSVSLLVPLQTLDECPPTG